MSDVDVSAPTEYRCRDGEHSPTNPRIISAVDGKGFETEAECTDCGATLHGYHDGGSLSEADS